jgi:hypothetical protein
MNGTRIRTRRCAANGGVRGAKRRVNLAFMPAILILAALLATPATARTQTIFACNLGAKRAIVTIDSRGFVYRYGTAKKADLTIVENAGSANLHAYWGRYVSPLRQLRFTAGEYSYLLYTMAANERMDTNGTAGLMVLRGTKVLSDRQCKPWVEFTGGFERIDALPQDEEDWSAMAL